MGNAVHGTQGAFVYANSPGTGAIRFLNTALLSTPTRASNGFQETVAQGVVDLGIGELLGAGLALSAKVASKLFGYPSEFLGEGAAVFKGVQAAKGEGAFTEGLAYRTDLPSHLAGPDGFTKSGQLSGTHNLQNATAALDAQGASYTINPTATAGVSELKYSYVNSATGKTVSGAKTVYDPAVFGDQTMLNYSMKAGETGWQQFLTNPAQRTFDVSHGGVNFRVYINTDKYGNNFVGNVHPIK